MGENFNVDLIMPGDIIYFYDCEKVMHSQQNQFTSDESTATTVPTITKINPRFKSGPDCDFNFAIMTLAGGEGGLPLAKKIPIKLGGAMFDFLIAG